MNALTVNLNSIFIVITNYLISMKKDRIPNEFGPFLCDEVSESYLRSIN